MGHGIWLVLGIALASSIARKSVVGLVKGRANPFKGAVMAHRNPLAHRKFKISAVSALSEFLLLNHLYKLEGQAIAMRRDAPDDATA